MGRVAGDAPGYTFRLCRMIGPVAKPTKTGFVLDSVTTIIKEVLGIPAGAMSWYGFREGLKALSELAKRDGLEVLQHADDPEQLEAFLKDNQFSPNVSRDAAGERGTKAHTVLECLAEAWREGPGRDWAEALAMDEEFTEGTRYGWAAITFWDEAVQPHIDSGEITDVLSEVPVYSLKHRYAGTFDLALEWVEGNGPGGWELLDAKTHKPASGFTKPGKGPGYLADALQNRAYRTAFEEMGLGRTIGQRTVVLRDREYKGKCWLDDAREVPFRLFELIREAYDIRKSFEEGDE